MRVYTPLEEVANERLRQDRKWGEQNHDPLYWYAILGEEFGEVGQALCVCNLEAYRAELIQVAAVAVAMVESMDRASERERRAAAEGGGDGR